jgi:ABC-type uncharacterized transport system substrate-binding protein
MKHPASKIPGYPRPDDLFRSAHPVAEKSRSALIAGFGVMLAQLVIFLAIFTLSFAVYAKDNNILILLSGNEDVYLDVATAITNSTIKLCRDRQLECQDTNFEISQIGSLTGEYNHQHRLIVTLGNKAAVFARNRFKDILIFSALIPKDSESDPAEEGDNPLQYYFYLDQPLQRSMLLIKALSDRFKHVGVLVSSSDNNTEKKLVESAVALKLSLYLEKVDSSRQIGASLNRLLDSSDVLLAVPDTKIHNKSTVTNILISAYRKRIPLIGFSSAYVKAGALAAVYSSPEDIAYQVRDNIVQHYSGEMIANKRQTAKYFAILFNSDVARSLDFPVKSESELETKMLRILNDNHD